MKNASPDHQVQQKGKMEIERKFKRKIQKKKIIKKSPDHHVQQKGEMEIERKSKR